MPPTTRILVRRDLKQAGVLLDRIMTYLVRGGSLYEEMHPEIFSGFCITTAAISKLQESLEALRESL